MTPRATGQVQVDILQYGLHYKEMHVNAQRTLLGWRRAVTDTVAPMTFGLMTISDIYGRKYQASYAYIVYHISERHIRQNASYIQKIECQLSCSPEFPLRNPGLPARVRAAGLTRLVGVD